jgi:hypothetical protein
VSKPEKVWKLEESYVFQEPGAAPSVQRTRTVQHTPLVADSKLLTHCSPYFALPTQLLFVPMDPGSVMSCNHARVDAACA